jgi:ATP-binding cassette subfamily C protein CydC
LERYLRAARRLYDIVDAEPQVSDPRQPQPMPKLLSLKVEDLCFRYPEMGSPGTLSTGVGDILLRSDVPWALDGASLSLLPGERKALVGPSGAGKSTLIHLLLRFWELQEGRILLDGRPLGEYAQDDLRKRIGVVSQSAYLFSASVADNLRVARPSASQAEIEGAARRAQVHDFIQSLPQGYDTWIGEQGTRLSGGERQRLAIARALLKDPPLLLLDEPTANLDALVERQVLAAIHELMTGRSVLMATHRLVGLEDMDEILVLDSGRVVARGRHAELLAAGGLYRRMWDLQNQVLVG